MRNFTMTAAAGLLSITVSFSAKASLTGLDQPQSESTIIEEQDYFPMCGLPLELQKKVKPDRLVLLKICI